jgi:(1->4)-alpha-D-glucan 1-alpha-D-glucosylmutase
MSDVPATPTSTLRLQMHGGFTFADAARQVSYAAELGISHYYLSPIMTARTGSTHGYDVVDPNQVNPELGGEDGLRALIATLREHDMGLVVDIVPNHMAVGRADNRAWLDLLEWGRASRHAFLFDVDWEVSDPALRHRVLAPFLGKPYGEALAAGELQLQFDHSDGRFFIAYFDHRFPVAPESLPWLLGQGPGDGLASLAGEFRSALRAGRATQGGAFEQTSLSLASRCAAQERPLVDDVDALLQHFNGESVRGRTALHRLLERQHYRLAWWRTAPDEINWRRFFDIIELAGLRIQEPASFEFMHGGLFRLYADGLVDGLRVDHVDGLADPRTYCRRLRERLARLQRERPEAVRHTTPYLVVEKILAVSEDLPLDWRVDGTTGYSFMNEVGALLHDPAGEGPLDQLWLEISGPRGDFAEQERTARRRIPQELLASDFNACAYSLHVIARSQPETRDWTLLAIRRVLAELLVHLDVYRTYADARGRSASDRAIMQRAVAEARPRCRRAERPLLDLVDRWLGGEPPREVRPVSARRARLHAIARFQQLSSPVAAKAVEDTVFYRHGRLLSRNEVGANPAQFSLSVAGFHAECVRRVHRFPHAMLATATHDHKRGEDARARLAVLSEVPDAWRSTVQRWRQAHRSVRAREALGEPDAIDEYMLYQTVFGAWPPTLRVDDSAGIDAFRERVQAWLLKAMREAKRHSSWTEPDEGYEHAAATFVDRLFARGRHGFLAEMAALVQRFGSAGALNSLAQIALKLGAPGVPDLYQGCEWWDFSLVDPDNRRPVDFDLRRDALGAGEDTDTLLTQWRDGRIKQRLLRDGLKARATCPALFRTGAYRPLQVIGAQAANVVAFARHDGVAAAVVVVPRLASRLVDPHRPRVVPERWGDTRLVLPRALRGRDWRSVHDPRPSVSADMALGELLRVAPVALLLDH